MASRYKTHSRLQANAAAKRATPFVSGSQVGVRPFLWEQHMLCLKLSAVPVSKLAPVRLEAAVVPGVTQPKLAGKQTAQHGHVYH